MKNQYITGGKKQVINASIDFVRENWGAIVTACGVLGIGLEIAPIKLRPVSWILKKIGNMMNADIINELNTFKIEFDTHLKNCDLDKINDIRKEIVDFSLSCQRGEHHTRDEFDRIFSRVGIYHDLLSKYKMQNGKIDIEVNYINKVYGECLEEHKFFEG